MPRKVKLTLKEKKEKIQEKRLLSQEETNSLEQMIEKDGEKVDFPEFEEFIKEQKIEISSSSPSLKKINPPQRNQVRLERDMITGAMSIETNPNINKEEEDNSFKYNQVEKKSEDAKYIKYNGINTQNIISKREFESSSMKNPFERREVKFDNPTQTNVSGQENFEKYLQPERLNKDRTTKKNPFERKEIKYTPEKY